jgi:UDP-glucose 4-epimerase
LILFSPLYIYHLGEYSRVEQSFDDIEKVWKSNKNGTFSVLQFCRKTDAKLIYAGSSTKFGDGGLGRNQSPYAWAKASNSELVVNYGEWFNLNYAIVYFYNVYGKREISAGKYATLIALFKQRTLKSQTLSVVSPGSQQRNFTHVDDIIDGLVLVGENGSGDEFGIGSPERYSVLEIAKMFGGEVQELPPRKGNRMTADVMIKKIECLGWKPTRNIRDHIQEFKEEHQL